MTPAAGDVLANLAALPMRGWSLDFDAIDRWLVLTDPDGASAIVAKDVDLEYGGDIAECWRRAAAARNHIDALRVATWRLTNAAASLASHAARADDPAHRSWFRSAIADVEREVRLARVAAGPEPSAAEYAAILAGEAE